MGVGLKKLNLFPHKDRKGLFLVYFFLPLKGLLVQPHFLPIPTLFGLHQLPHLVELLLLQL